MEFWKMNGAGNDFIVVDDRRNAVPDHRWPELARTLCQRHLSIGADGLMVVKPPACGGDYRMLFFNSDGSMGEMCGNGARCICRYGYETGLSGPIQKVETTAGLVIGERIDRRQYRVRLNDPTVIDLDRTAMIGGEEIPCGYVELGNPGLPHAVVHWPGLANADNDLLFKLGRALRCFEGFPKGANVNFYDMLGQDHVLEKTYERGVEDFTLACGTGTGSVVTVLTKRGLVSGKQVQVDMPGGTLTVDVEQENDTITGLFLTGPTNLVAKGEIFDEEL